MGGSSVALVRSQRRTSDAAIPAANQCPSPLTASACTRPLRGVASGSVLSCSYVSPFQRHCVTGPSPPRKTSPDVANATARAATSADWRGATFWSVTVSQVAERSPPKTSREPSREKAVEYVVSFGQDAYSCFGAPVTSQTVRHLPAVATRTWPERATAATA